jgi:predicted amidohydrolase
MSATARALASVATCNLCQWAMEFDTNLANVRRSILIAKSRGCTLRTGPELELTGCDLSTFSLLLFLFSCWSPRPQSIRCNLILLY